MPGPGVPPYDAPGTPRDVCRAVKKKCIYKALILKQTKSTVQYNYKTYIQRYVELVYYRMKTKDHFSRFR